MPCSGKSEPPYEQRKPVIAFAEVGFCVVDAENPDLAREDSPDPLLNDVYYVG